jgi:glutathione S-transferase
MATNELLLTLDNPVFHTYLITASLMLLKLMLQPWMTLQRMLKVNAGFRNPEDLKQSPLNRNPNPQQTDIHEYVDRSRRINLNDLESIPGFVAVGLLFVLVSPPVLFAQVVLWTYVVARALHFVAYITAQLHDIRATFWTFSSMATIVMAGYVLMQAMG